MSKKNLITNPSFETNLTDWSFANCTATRDSVTTNGTGSFSAKMVSTHSQTNMIAQASVSGLIVGKKYTASVYIKVQATGDPFSVDMSIDGKYASLSPVYNSDFFQRRYFGFTATAPTATLRVISETETTSGDIIWIDRVQLNEGGLLPYFDGSYPYSSWDGTANHSTSTCTALDGDFVGAVTTDEAVLVNGLCLNTLAWNITTKGGRYSIPNTRGDDITVPGQSGVTWVANKPRDAGLWALTMFILGSHPDGSIPSAGGMRSAFDYNFDLIMRQCVTTSAPVTLYAWQPDGSVRTAQASTNGQSIAADIQMGGRRGDITIPFDILESTWEDFSDNVTTGTPGAGWSDKVLQLHNLVGGTAPIEDSVIQVFGPITNPTLTNVATGTSVTLTGTVADGNSWVIDCSNWSSLNNGVDVTANTTHVGHPRYIVIDPGNILTAPQIHVTGTSTGGNTNVIVTARRKHWTA